MIGEYFLGALLRLCNLRLSIVLLSYLVEMLLMITSSDGNAPYHLLVAS